MQQRAVRVTPPRAERLLGFWQIPNASESVLLNANRGF